MTPLNFSPALTTVIPQLFYLMGNILEASRQKFLIIKGSVSYDWFLRVRSDSIALESNTALQVGMWFPCGAGHT
jgi:hypothetical protein